VYGFRLIFAYAQPMSRYDRPSHQMYMSFMNARGGWYCQFLEPDLKTPLPKTLTFADAEKQRAGAPWGGDGDL
jgi:hypothetical protein